MAKVLRVATAGLAAAVLASLVGCSQGSEPETSAASDPATEQTATDEATNESTAEATDVEADTSTAKAASEYRVVEDLTLPAPGSDPLAMVFQMRQFTGEPIGSEQIKVTYPTPDRAVVTTTVRGLPDDSVSAIRTRYEFQPAEGSADKPLWQIVQVTQQNKCQSGRGSEEWTGDLCQ